MKLHHNIEASHGSNCKNLVQNHNTTIKVPRQDAQMRSVQDSILSYMYGIFIKLLCAEVTQNLNIFFYNIEKGFN